MKVNSIQCETFSGNATKAVAQKGYSILVGGERYIVGASKDVISKNGGAKSVLFNTLKRITLQPKNAGLNIIA